MSAVMPRMMELTTPLVKDLLFRWLRGKEELGRASEFELGCPWRDATKRSTVPIGLDGHMSSNSLFHVRSPR